MKAPYRICLIAALAAAMSGAVSLAQNVDNARVEKQNRRVIRVSPDDENAEIEKHRRRIVRVFSTSGDEDSEDGSRVVFIGEGGPDAYGYSYGFHRKRGYLGVQLVELTPELREHFGGPGDAGVLVSDIADDSPAAKAGLEVGDVLTAIDGDSVATGFDVARRISGYEDGAAISLEIWRDRRVQTLSATIVERDRPAIDLGRFVLPDLSQLGKGIKIDIESFPERVIEIDEDGIHEALRDLQLKFADPGMFEKFQVLGQNRIDLEERLLELEERLKGLEQQLEKLPED